MKIASIIEEGRFGGPQMRIIRTVSDLKKEAGIEITIIIPSLNSGKFREKLEGAGLDYKVLRITRLSRQNIWLMLTYLLSFPFELLGLYLYLKKGKFDIVHVNGGSWQVKGIIAGKLAGMKTVWHMNDTCIPWIVRTFFKFVYRFFTPKAVIFQSWKARKYYESFADLSASWLNMIPAPADTESFIPGKREDNGKVLAVACMGNISPVKGYAYFIEAASILKEKYPDVKFVIAGSKLESQIPYYEKIKEMGEKAGNTCFAGFVDDTSEFLRQTDIFVCSSINESSPLAVREAMSMELPVVSSDVGDVSDYVKDGEGGFIVPPADSEALSAKIEILINSPDLRNKFGKVNRDTAEKLLDIKICNRKLMDIYQGLLEGKRV